MSRYRWRWISFLSDYGQGDEFVGVCHGVMATLAPRSRVIDITHAVPAGDVRRGAVLLARAVSYLPPGVHLAVVDPGVGTKRRGVVISAAQGSVLVGPDNGLLLAAAQRLGGVAACHCLENPAFMLSQPSRTFHGRDLFAPAAAHLCLGVPAREFGAELAAQDLVRLDTPAPRWLPGHCSGVILASDRFGNLSTTIPPAMAQQAGLAPGMTLHVTLGGRSWSLPYGRTFASVAAGEAVLLEDSDGLLALCVNQGSALEWFSAPVQGAAVGHQGGTWRTGAGQLVGEEIVLDRSSARAERSVAGEHPVDVHDAEHAGQGDGG